MPSGLFALAIPVAKAVSRWRQPEVPVGIPLAIAKRESGFNPDAIPIDAKTGKPRSSATGIWQILKGSAPQYGVTVDQRKDIDATTRGAIKVFVGYSKLIKQAFPRVDPDNLAGLIYLGHWQGTGSLKKALAAMKRAGQTPTVENATAALKIPSGPPSDVRGQWRYWQRAADDLGNNWDGLLAWGAQQGGPTYVGRKRKAVPAGLGGGAGGGGGGAVVIAVAVAALLLLKKK